MKKMLLGIAVAAILGTGIAASAADDVRPYIDVHAGALVNNDKDINGSSIMYAPGIVAGAAVGLDFDIFRLEAKVDYRKADIDKFASAGVSGDLQLWSYMIDGYLSPPIQFPVKPYVLGGLGFATARVSDFSGSPAGKQNDTRFAYELGAGLGYEITRNAVLDFSYRYLKASDFDFNSVKWGYTSNNFIFGVRYLF